MKNWQDDMPSHESIARYWEGREIPGGTYIPIIDAYEPGCFACGWCRLDHVRSPAALKQTWRGLERAHVVARSLGGPDIVENIVLLCKKCHEDAPDVGDAKRFWGWIENHERWGTLVYMLKIDPFDPENLTKVRNYRGPGGSMWQAMTFLTEAERSTLLELMSHGGFSIEKFRAYLSQAEHRVGGYTLHFNKVSVGTYIELFREIASMAVEGSLELG
jgi:hypothetical protein